MSHHRTHLKALLTALPGPISTDAHGVAALTIGFGTGTVFTVAGGHLVSNVTSGTAINFDLGSYTLTSLATAINAVSGYSASVIGSIGALRAAVLLSGSYDATQAATTIPYYTSGIYQILSPVATVMDDAEDALETALRQSDLRYADTIWLDRWGDLYGIPRATGETDAFYGRRINFSAVQPKTNNNAIAIIILQGLGVAGATVIDSAVPSLFTVNLTLSDGSANPYNTSAINSFIETYKALGTVGILSLSSLGSESYTTTITPTDTLIDTIEFGGGAWSLDEWSRREFGG